MFYKRKVFSPLLNLKTLVRGIQGIIPGGITIKDFCVLTQTNEDTARNILDNFMQNGIGQYEDDQVFFKDDDRLKTSILAINMGASIDEISVLLRWQDFEALVAKIFETRDFETRRNVFLKNPRMQIDVIGIKSGIAIIIDCKHWKRMSDSSLRGAVKKQVERTKHFISKEKVTGALPAIVTLYQHELKFIDKVPIIPIYQLDAFCEEFYGNLEEIQS